ncbi:MAG: laccase domain-containing protein, partial [Nocardioides sp.]
MTFGYRHRITGDHGSYGFGFTDATRNLAESNPTERDVALAELARETGARPVLMEQVHGADVEVVSGPGERPRADGIVTLRAEIALVVRAADCVPVLLADPGRGVIGAAHAGRAGVAADVTG